MENDQTVNPSKDQKQQVVITSSSSSSSDHDQTSTGGGGDGGGGASQVVVRWYECTFCKRGFSNAQALGGHMNIHRKDKAKMKQSSSSPSADKYYGEDRIQMIRWPWINLGGGGATDDDDTTTQQFLNMPSFVPKPTSSHGQDKTNISQVPDKDSQCSDLDLELRLAPPHDSSTMETGTETRTETRRETGTDMSTGTRKFF